LNAPLADTRGRAGVEQADTLLLSSDPREVIRRADLKPEALALLSEIKARLHGVDMPVVQFINLSGEASAANVTASFAQASAACIGRTLLVRPRQPGSQEDRRLAATPPLATIPRRRTRKAVSASIEIVPDSIVPGLCHAYLGGEPAEASTSRSSPSEIWLDGVTLDFKLIVIESSAPERAPATLDLATRCHGNVLVVTASMTRLSQVRSVMRQIQLAGGTLMGSVLHDAPTIQRLSIISKLLRLNGKSGE
jgi:hypothetical protein